MREKEGTLQAVVCAMQGTGLKGTADLASP